MRKSIHTFLLSLIVLLASTANFVVEGAVLRANPEAEQGDESEANLNNVAVERELQRRRRDRGKGGKGKGGSKGSGGGGLTNGGPIRFLPDRIEPIPFVNCIPLPPGFDLDDGKMMGKAKGRDGRYGGGKGKGGKGKGDRRDRRGMIRERVLKHNSYYRDNTRNGRHRGGNRHGGRRNGGGGGGNRGMMMGRLPFCPLDAPTFFPTTLPSFTPIPTWTPLPSITPFPSFTPFPSLDGEGGPGGPTVPGAPSPGGPGGTPGAPVVLNPGSGVPVAVPDGTTRILVESTLEFRFFDGVTAREPTQEEIDGLMVETTRFYTDILSAAFPNLESFQAVFVESQFNAANDLPVLIDFDANSFIFSGKQ